MAHRPARNRVGRWIGLVYLNLSRARANSTSSAGSSLVFARGLEIQVTLIRSCQVMLLLVLLPPQEPQPKEKVWRMPFHRLPLLEGAWGWLTMTREVLVPRAYLRMLSSL